MHFFQPTERTEKAPFVVRARINRLKKSPCYFLSSLASFAASERRNGWNF